MEPILFAAFILVAAIGFIIGQHVILCRARSELNELLRAVIQVSLGKATAKIVNGELHIQSTGGG